MKKETFLTKKRPKIELKNGKGLLRDPGLLKETQLGAVVCDNSLPQVCPGLDKKLLTQQVMADLPPHQLTPCSPFTNVSCDYMGPYKVKGIVNPRMKLKIYGAVKL